MFKKKFLRPFQSIRHLGRVSSSTMKGAMIVVVHLKLYERGVTTEKEDTSYGVDVYSLKVNTGLTNSLPNRYIRVRGLLVLQVGGFTLRREASTLV